MSNRSVEKKQYYLKNRERILNNSRRFYRNASKEWKENRKTYHSKWWKIRSKYWINENIKYLGSKCAICGITDKDVLVFHHKEGQPEIRGDFRTRKIDKNIYILLCANCHLKIHKKLNTWIGRPKTII